MSLRNILRAHGRSCRLSQFENRYSFADREWDYVVKCCERNGIAFIPWFPLTAGTVAGMVLENIAKKRPSRWRLLGY
jgi:aryl-alcohol dehydrogenase-like predicted oxidoreductase